MTFDLLNSARRRVALLYKHISQLSPLKVQEMSNIYHVGSPSEFKDGEKKEWQVPGTEDKLLISQINGQVYASASKCTHYGAPLVNGVLGPDGRIVCPWHGACFQLCNGGEIEDAPAWDRLPMFKTQIKDDKILVQIDNLDELKPCRKGPVLVKRLRKSPAPLVIVGGGASGYCTAETLRARGYLDEICIISKEKNLPIDRTKLSKALITDASQIEIRKADDVVELGVKLITDTSVTSVDTTAKSVTLSNGTNLTYETLVLSTGGTPRRLPIENFDKSNVHVLRYVEHAKDIVAATQGGKKKVVIVGSSFIGMEVALPLAKENDVTVIGMESVPLERVLGEKIGARIQKMHEGNGIKFEMSAEIDSAVVSNADPTKVESIKLKNGKVLPADVVILGVGVAPETSYLKGNPAFNLQKDQSLLVDAYMRVQGVEGVYATGDIATFPYKQLGADLRVEHWDVAMNQGITAAEHIALGSSAKPYDATLYFWSAQGSQLRYCGSTAAGGFDDVYVQGDLEKSAFAAFYCQGEKVVAVASMGYDPAVSLSAELMRQRRMPSKSELKSKDIKEFSSI